MLNLDKHLIPKPQKIEATGIKTKITAFFKSECRIEALASDDRISEAVSLIKARLGELSALSEFNGDYAITIRVDSSDPAFSDIEKNEAYYIKVENAGATLCGKDAAGAFYAAVTFADMLFAEGDAVYAEVAYILDYPDFMSRGHFIESRYGTEFLTLKDWQNFIDYMAKMKVNSITIGVYGCWGVQYDSRRMEYFYVPIKKQPELITKKNIKYYSVKDRRWVHKDDIIPYMYENDSLGEVIKYAKRKNITVKPLINSLGHNSLIPRLNPEASAKNESGEATGWGFCTNSEKTYEILFNIYDEIIERHLEPNGIKDIHIGLDEVGDSAACKCEKCKLKPRPEHMVAHIIRLAKHLIEKGMKRIYIYHDMLYDKFNIINEELRDLFIKEGIYDNIVIDWWTYEDPKHLFWNKPEGVNNLFHSVIKPDTGYYNWTLPTENNENIRACAKMAAGLGFEGMETYSSFEYCYDKNYLTLADVAWNNSTIDGIDEFNDRYAYRNYPEDSAKAATVFNGMFDAMKDETGEMYMNRICYHFDYYFYCYRKAGNELKDFPGGAFKKIIEKESTYIPYFEYLKQKSAPAVEFFENARPTKNNQNWLLTAKQYFVMADEYLTLYGLYKSYNAGCADEYAVLCELQRLLRQREALMLLAESVRIPATSYTYLRNMSVFRQVLIDLSDYFKRTISSGEKPKLDLADLSYAMSERFEFLR